MVIKKTNIPCFCFWYPGVGIITGSCFLGPPVPVDCLDCLDCVTEGLCTDTGFDEPDGEWGMLAADDDDNFAAVDTEAGMGVVVDVVDVDVIVVVEVVGWGEVAGTDK